ncbi:UNVERIFIED_CONTAM: hypothetical protein K2H54_064823, partial [Gekko kuhli]
MQKMKRVTRAHKSSALQSAFEGQRPVANFCCTKTAQDQMLARGQSRRVASENPRKLPK